MQDDEFTVTDWLLYVLLCVVVLVIVSLLTLLLFPEFSFDLWLKV